jgi:SAM-dependent methyltransferase
MTRVMSIPVLRVPLNLIGGAVYLILCVVNPIVRRLSAATRRLSAATHRGQALAEAAAGRDVHWYEHHVDVEWNWPRNGRWEWLARGVLSGFTIRDGARVLDVASGDGFFARHFYAPRAAEVVGVDIDPCAVAHAARINGASNLSFKVADISTELPDGPFDNAIWDAGITYLAPDARTVALRGIAQRLTPDGLLSGYTDRDPDPAPGELHVFADGGDVARALHEVFGYVCVIEFRAGTRRMHQFYAAMKESAIPVSRASPGVTWIG